MATLSAQLPLLLRMPLGAGAPGMHHGGTCLLVFLLDPPSPIVRRLVGDVPLPDGLPMAGWGRVLARMCYFVCRGL